MSTKKKPAQKSNHRPTIGVIVDSMISGYQIGLWRGLKAAAKEHDVNLFCFLGREIESTIEYRQQANAIYNLINENSVDGLIVLTGTISHFIEQVELEAYLKSFSPLPTVSIAIEVNEIPSILLDNQQGIYEMMAHLIETHHYQEIGFVRFREGHAEGDLRFQAYQEALEKYGLTYNPDLVVPGEYYDNPEAAVRLLYEERQVKPDAIVVIDDYMAVPMIEILQRHGIQVPKDVAIVGFDDIEEARYVDSPLTTLRQPLREQANQAIELVLAALQEENVSQKVELTPSLIIRQSCGCFPAHVVDAAFHSTTEGHSSASLSESQDEILAGIFEKSEFSSEQPIRELVQTFIVSLEQSDSDYFLTSFASLLRQSEMRQEDIMVWQSVISALRFYGLNGLQAKPEIARAENLIQQSRVMISEAAQRVQAKRRLEIQAQNLTFRNLSQALNTTRNFSDLSNALDQGLPGLGISEFTVSIYEQNDPTAQIFRLILAHTANGRADLPNAGLDYPSSELLPPEFIANEHCFAKLVEPLYFRDTQFGFAIFEGEALNESIYDALAEQISSSLKGIQLGQQVEQRAIQLQTASEVSKATSSILDPEELIHQTVDLVKSRFGLYYVGIFLVDENQKWAILRAGTGQPGKEMLAANWRLEIGGKSMIGRCTATGAPDIQLNVDQAPVHLRNPYLPETKSELALPLISRGEILGALTIQSRSANAFTTEDIAILQTMADQLANAIGNAYLYDALAREQNLMNALMDNMPDAIYFKDRESRFLRISRYMVSNFGVDNPNDLIGKTDFDFFTEEHARPAFEDEQKIIQTGEPLLNIEELETWEDRPSTWGLTSKLPLYDAHGEIVGTFGITRNITDLKRIQLTQEHQSQQLQTTIEVARAISEILDPNELTQQIVDLIKERFDLYYVGFFVINEFRDRAILRAGTGEPGRKMVAENWQLEIGGESMIGRCIQTGNPDIQLDVDKAPAHLRNPHLPETKSEMALPLFSRGEILGALTIQSSEPNAFSTEDTVILQTMANQISVALANARLFEQTQTALMETETLLNVSRLASSTIGVDFALPQILDLVLKATQIDSGLISLIDPETNQLELTVQQVPEEFRINLETHGLEGTLCDLVFQQKKPIIVSDLETQSPIDVSGIIRLGYKSYQGVPIETKGEVFGTLCTFSLQRMRDEDSRISLLQAIGRQIGVAIENIRLFEQTQTTLAQTANLYLGSEKIIKANTIQTILEALVETTPLKSMDRVGLVIFDHPWDEHQQPEGMTITANWTQPEVDVRAPVGTYYKLNEYPLAKVIGLREPVFIDDFHTTANIDEQSKAYILKVLGSTSAISLPLVVGNQSIGGIVALSGQKLHISDADVRQIISLTDQAATVIQSIRLYEQTQATLAELENTQRRYQIQAWSAYNQTRESSGYQKTPDGVKPLQQESIPEANDAFIKQEPIVSKNGTNATLTIPIMLRDQPIGVVGLQGGEGKRQWGPDEIALAQEISEQFALAAESLRLLDETQRRAARERLVAEITTKLRATNDPQAMLQTAVQELRTALNAKRTQVLLQKQQISQNAPEPTSPNDTERGEP
jgi:PAS domain S-box-containing protein